MSKMKLAQMGLRIAVYALIAFTFFAGLPQFHYGVALMVFLLIKCKDNPAKLFARV
jgi:hypothetical protein